MQLSSLTKKIRLTRDQPGWNSRTSHLLIKSPACQMLHRCHTSFLYTQIEPTPCQNQPHLVLVSYSKVKPMEYQYSMNTKIWVVPMTPRVFLPMGICIQNQILNFLVSIKRSGTFMFKETSISFKNEQMADAIQQMRDKIHRSFGTKQFDYSI